MPDDAHANTTAHIDRVTKIFDSIDGVETHLSDLETLIDEADTPPGVEDQLRAVDEQLFESNSSSPNHGAWNALPSRLQSATTLTGNLETVLLGPRLLPSERVRAVALALLREPSEGRPAERDC